LHSENLPLIADIQRIINCNEIGSYYIEFRGRLKGFLLLAAFNTDRKVSYQTETDFMWIDVSDNYKCFFATVHSTTWDLK
jgi:hypothetical protein